MKQELVEWLRVPREALDELRPHALRAAVILAASILLAWVLGRLLALWVRRLGGEKRLVAGEQMARATAAHVPVLIGLLGVYAAVGALRLGDRLLGLIGAITFVAAVAVGLRFAVHLSSALLRGYFEHRAKDGAARERAEREYLPLARTSASVALTLVALIFVAHHFHHDVTSLVAALGVGSLAIGLAAQQTLGNMIAGFVLLVDRPFRPGDRVRLATGEEGEVTDIGIRSTRILLAESNLLIVPNTELANTRVVNYAFPSERVRGEVHVTLPIGADVKAWSQTLLACAEAEEEVLEDPAPVVRVATFDREQLELVVRFAVARRTDQAAVEERLRRHALERAQGERAKAPPPAVV